MVKRNVLALLTGVLSQVSLLNSDRLQALITETVVFKSNNMKPVM